MITYFRNNYWFLSNFYAGEEPVWYNGRDYSTAEHAYQSAKAAHIRDALIIRNAVSPAEAKRLGKKVEMKSGWEDMKDEVMLDILLSKFKDPRLQAKLLATGGEKLVEGNYWHDNYWGSCHCDKCKDKGKNVLGELLMEVRGTFGRILHRRERRNK